MSEEHNDLEDSNEETDLWCYGEMVSVEDEEFIICEKCDLYYQCFSKTYGEEVWEWKKAENIELSEEDILEIFLSDLLENPSSLLENVNVQLEKPRKIIKKGDSYGVTIPAILNQIYPKNSPCLTLWSKTQHLLFFFGKGSFIPENTQETLRAYYKNKTATFRTVNYVKLNVLIIPRQFMQFFNATRKIRLEFSKSSNVVYVKSNLNDLEVNALFQKQREKEQHKTHTVYSHIKPQDQTEKPEWYGR
ncbi:hypothetical protein KJA15_03560 [Patescibacteria group bacterium]|nr:hypothetical protein [Patescibacteria group bacterium]